MIFCTVYTSRSSEPWDDDALLSLLSLSRRRNAEAGITGLLLYRDEAFMQVLEGEEEAVRALYRRIAADPRHHDVACIWVAESPRRRFGDWSMGFRDLGERGVDLDGYHDLLAEPVDLGRLARRDVVARLLAHLAPGLTARQDWPERQPSATLLSGVRRRGRASRARLLEGMQGGG